MKLDDIKVEGFVPATPAQIYAAWLDSAGHTAMTGGEANITAEVGVDFTAWDGHVSGRILELEPPGRIVQAWRTEHFPKEAADSRVEITLTAEGDGTRIHLNHTGIPPGMGVLYETGWVDRYITPMTAWAQTLADQPDSA